MKSQQENRCSEPVLISACLLSIPCRYNGRMAESILDYSCDEIPQYQFIPVCPEQLGGLPTPRVPAEISGGDGFDVLDDEKTGRVINKDGIDITDRFIDGARYTLQIARSIGATKMITQKNSPSCSCFKIYNGDFSNKLKDGKGVAAAYLEKNDIELIDIDKFNIHIRNCHYEKKQNANTGA